MTPAFIFKFGSLDLSAYVRVGEDGLDPYDGDGFEDPQFLESPLSEGQALSNVDVGNRQQAWPLYLNAASKDALHQLVRRINAERSAPGPLRVEWRDQGASASTFYDVEYSRFDPAFALRQAGQGWLAGVLRVWTRPPYGHTGTERIVATSFASAWLTVATIPAGSVAGDAPAQLRVGMNRPAQKEYGGATSVHVAALSVIPSGYQPFIAAPSFFSMASPGVGTTGDGQAMASAVWSFGGNNLFWLRTSIDGNQYKGRHRVMAMIRHGHPSGVALSGGQPDGNGWTTTGRRIGPTAVASNIVNQASGYRLLDLGVLSLPTSHPVASSYLDVYGGVVGNNLASVLMLFNGVLILPEDTTTMLTFTYGNADTSNTTASVIFFGPDGVTEHQHFDVSARQYTVPADGHRFGAIPNLPVSSASQLQRVVGVFVDQARRNIAPLSLEVRARERFTFAR